MQVIENHKQVYEIEYYWHHWKKTQSKYKAYIAIVKNNKDLTFERQLLVKAQTLLIVNLKQLIELVCKQVVKLYNITNMCCSDGNI